MPPPSPTPATISGLVLAGGRGSRMGGVDKGLVPFRGRPLVATVIDRLSPQVSTLAISANRHADAYGAFGWPVRPDDHADYPGPLAGIAAGLAQASTDWVVVVPCDAPGLPTDLVARLAQAAETAPPPRPPAVVARIPGGGRQPVFCLLHRRVEPGLRAFLAAGGRRVGQWLDSLAPAEAWFDDEAAFANANTPEELRRLEAGG